MMANFPWEMIFQHLVYPLGPCSAPPSAGDPPGVHRAAGRRAPGAGLAESRRAAEPTPGRVVGGAEAPGRGVDGGRQSVLPNSTRGARRPLIFCFLRHSECPRRALHGESLCPSISPRPPAAAARARNALRSAPKNRVFGNAALRPRVVSPCAAAAEHVPSATGRPARRFAALSRWGT